MRHVQHAQDLPIKLAKVVMMDIYSTVLQQHAIILKMLLVQMDIGIIFQVDYVLLVIHSAYLAHISQNLIAQSVQMDSLKIQMDNLVLNALQNVQNACLQIIVKHAKIYIFYQTTNALKLVPSKLSKTLSLINVPTVMCHVHRALELLQLNA